MTMDKIYINQSLVKDLIKYQNDEICGLVLTNKWVLKQFGSGTKSNSLGHYFEYLCTGALAKGVAAAFLVNSVSFFDAAIACFVPCA